jgi:dienelactone hydrolase
MRIEFDSDGKNVVGELYLPDGDGRFGAAVLLGPLTSVKEQATEGYARALARRGWAALSFDPRYFGESAGEPRQYENPEAKIADVQNAVTFLSKHERVDPERVVAVGVCAGAGYMAGAVAQEQRFRAFGAVAGFYHDAAQQLQWMGQETYQAALAKARKAREAWEAGGEAEHIPAVGKNGDVAMPLDEAFEYYGTDRGGNLGHYLNSFAIMSREKTLPYDAQSAASRIRVPTVLVHSEKALAPQLARAFYDQLNVDKQLFWLESAGQIDFYDDPQLIEPATDHLVALFDKRSSQEVAVDLK